MTTVAANPGSPMACIDTICPFRLIALIAFIFLPCMSVRAVPEFKTFVDKAASGQPVVIAYLGGSITRGATTWPRSGKNVSGAAYDYSSYDSEKDSWRALTFQWLRSRYEKVPGQFKQIDAAIGGTPSLLGAYRLEENVLSARPDLVFVEFAVNDNGKAKLTREHPGAAGSILRTIDFIVRRLREQNPRMAIFMPLSTRRMLPGSSLAAWGDTLDVGLEQTLLAAEAAHVPYVNLKEAFYGDANNSDAGLYYDGPDDNGNYVHPAPAGHRAYAKAVEEALTKIFQMEPFAFRSSGEMSSIRPYPVSPRLILPGALASHAPSWKVETPASAESPVLEARPCLVTGAAGSPLEYPFKGTAIGLWCNNQSRGTMAVELDGKKLGLYSNGVKTHGKFSGRFCDLSEWLDDSVSLHTLRLIPVAEPDAPNPRIMLYALTLDNDAPESRQ